VTNPIERISKQVEEMIEEYVLMSPAEIDNFLKRLKDILYLNFVQVTTQQSVNKEHLLLSRKPESAEGKNEN